jgi:hypothetical protein
VAFLQWKYCCGGLQTIGKSCYVVETGIFCSAPVKLAHMRVADIF